VTQINHHLSGDGWVLVRGLRLADPPSHGLSQLVEQVAGRPLEYRERSSPRTHLGHGVYSSTEYPASEDIHLHNENSYQLDWPMRLFFHCVRPADAGGATPLADTRQILRAIDPVVRERFRSSGWCVVRNYHDNMGLSWRDSFGLSDPAELSRFCVDHGLTASWHDGTLRTSALRQAIHVHPVTGQELWFNHVVVFHLGAHSPEVRSALTEMFTADELPTHTWFGDGEAIDDDVIAHLKDCYAAARFRFDYLPGDVLIIDNMLVAHGREAFTGDRKVAVAMAAPHSGYVTA
jgi:alpha-ketoglutarate-dependent taurine dioxygenase